jgi:hypothetical protein
MSEPLAIALDRVVAGSNLRTTCNVLEMSEGVAQDGWTPDILARPFVNLFVYDVYHRLYDEICTRVLHPHKMAACLISRHTTSVNRDDVA